MTRKLTTHPWGKCLQKGKAYVKEYGLDRLKAHISALRMAGDADRGRSYFLEKEGVLDDGGYYGPVKINDDEQEKKMLNQKPRPRL